jgi:hypothetical protein
VLSREVDVEHVELSARTGPDWKWILHDLRMPVWSGSPQSCTVYSSV